MTSRAAAAAAGQHGIVPGRTYRLIVANDMMSAGKLVRLRGFAGDPEWNGRWSTARRRDVAAAPAAGLCEGRVGRHLLDGLRRLREAFHVGVRHSVADDQWSKFTVKSRWMEVSAGGAPSFVSFRDNPQWHLALQRDRSSRSSSRCRTRAPSADLLETPPIGLIVLRGNGGADGGRRKLRVASKDDIVFQLGQPHGGFR